MKVADPSSKPVVLNSEPREDSGVKDLSHPRGWMPPLDGIRGLAILMVMLRHYNTLPNRSSLPQHIVWSLTDFGWTGVDLFFVLSGFLITGILLDSRGAENYFLSFYMRRVLRIFPVYYVSLGVRMFVVPAVFWGTTPLSLHDRILYFVYAQNWPLFSGHPSADPFLAHYWSLGVEEQFYLLWPLVIFLFPARSVFKITIGGSLSVFALRLVLLMLHISPITIYSNTFARADSLLIGAACVFLIRDELVRECVRRHVGWLWLIPVISLTLLRIASHSSDLRTPLMQSVGYAIFALSFATLIASVVVITREDSLLLRFFTSRVMTTLGKYSYSAYIWHILVLKLVLRFEHATLHAMPPAFLNIPLLIAATLAVSMCSYSLIERPFLSFKRYFEPRYGN